MTTNTQPQPQQSGGDNGSAQIAAMKQLGFDPVETVYGWCYVKEVAENPAHLTNGRSYLQLTRNQADEILQLIQARERAARIDELQVTITDYASAGAEDDPLYNAEQRLLKLQQPKPQAGEGGEV